MQSPCSIQYVDGCNRIVITYLRVITMPEYKLLPTSISADNFVVHHRSGVSTSIINQRTLQTNVQ